MVDFTPHLPDTANVDDTGHVDDHNAIVAALHTLSDAVDALDLRVGALEDRPAPPPWEPPYGAAYGSAMSMDALGNAQVGGDSSGADNNLVSFYFKAEQSSTLVGFKVYWLGYDESGYGGGTGGTYSITVEADDGGEPSGVPLATQTFACAYPNSYFGEITFASPATLTAGNIYHLVFENTSAAPKVDFASVNLTMNQTPTTPRCAKYADADFGMLRKFDTDPWGDDPSDAIYIPILDLRYGNGRHQGQGYMEVEYDSGLGARVDATGGKETRLRFTPTIARLVSGVHVRLAKETGGSGDALIALKQGSTTLGSVVVTGSGLDEGEYTDANAGASGTFEGGDFASPVSLAAGTEYTLLLTGDAGADIWTRPIQSGGADYGFHPGTFFSEVDSNGDPTVVLECRDTANTADVWTEPEGTAGCGCLQFYFT